MSELTKNTLKSNYHMLGDLDSQRFLAIKSIQKGLLHIKEIDLTNIQLVDRWGGTSPIDPQYIQSGDTIKVSVTIGDMIKHDDQRGVLTIRDITAASFDPSSNNFLYLENNKFCYTNVDCTREIIALEQIINDRNLWPNRNNLTQIITQDTTLVDFQEVKEEMMRENMQSRDRDGNSLNIAPLNIPSPTLDPLPFFPDTPSMIN